MRSRRKLAVHGLIACASFSAAWYASVSSYFPKASIEIWWPDRGDVYRPAERPRGDRELLFVFIGSPTSAQANAPELPALIERAKVQVRAQARAINGHGFAVAGIARAASAEEGLRYLRRFGAFDEVIAGGGWFNHGILKYVFSDLPGPATTPQVIIVERTLDRPSKVITNEQELTRRAGLQHIEAWVHGGSPVQIMERNNQRSPS